MPFVSCIVLSHDKPDYVSEAIDSLLAQTFPDWEAVIFDSGVLTDRGYFATLPAMQDPRLRLVRSWETEELRQSKTIASWCFNECFRSKLLSGQYVTYLCDDDLYYPNAFQAFYDHVQAHPETQAMYAAVDMTGVNEVGEKVVFRESPARELKGSCCGGGDLDCHVDYLQLCHKADLFNLFPPDDFWPEDRAVITHADGIFLERIGARVPIVPVAAKIGENRKVPSSLNTGGQLLEQLLKVRRLEAEVLRLERELAILNNRRLVRLPVRIVKRFPALHRLAKKLALVSRQAWQSRLGRVA